MNVTLDHDVAVDLIRYKIRRVQDLIHYILERWNVTDANDFLNKSKEGVYPESENDAIDLKQLLFEEKKLKALLQGL